MRLMYGTSSSTSSSSLKQVGVMHGIDWVVPCLMAVCNKGLGLRCRTEPQQATARTLQTQVPALFYAVLQHPFRLWRLSE
jgi:hypothetical protein